MSGEEGDTGGEALLSRSRSNLNPVLVTVHLSYFVSNFVAVYILIACFCVFIACSIERFSKWIVCGFR